MYELITIVVCAFAFVALNRWFRRKYRAGSAERIFANLLAFTALSSLGFAALIILFFAPRP